MIQFIVLLLILLCQINVNAFTSSGLRSKSMTKTTLSTQLRMGLFDMFKPDPEAEAKKEAEKEEMMRAQREILERRRNPKKMRVYEDNYEARRLDLAKERAVYNFQAGDQGDPLDEFNRLKKAGKIKVSGEERDAGSSRLGSEGLQEVRTDERMPYIDSGYVPEEQQPEKKTVVKKVAAPPVVGKQKMADEEDDDDIVVVKVGKKRNVAGGNRVAAFTDEVATEEEEEEERIRNSGGEASDVLGNLVEDMADGVMKGFKGLFDGKE